MTAAGGHDLVDRLTSLGLEPWGAPVALTRGEVEALCTRPPYEGLTALLGAAVERGLVEVDHGAADVLTAAWAERMAWCVQLDSVLLEVVERLTAGGIATRVLKGVAIASLDEPDPTWRSYGDIDVLVPEARLLEAADALAGLGMRPAIDPVGWRWAARHAKSVTLLGPDGVQVDLHRTLAAGPFGARLRTTCLFEQGQPFEVGGTTLTALAPLHRFLHACYHAALGGSRGPRHRRDILLLAQGVTAADVNAALADGWSPIVLAAALRWAQPRVSATAGVADTLGGDAATHADDERLLQAYAGSYREMAMAELRAQPGPLAKTRYAAALVWPSRANLAARGQGRLDHLRRLAGRVRPRRSE